MSTRHGVQIAGEGTNVSPHVAVCACGWMSRPRVGIGAHWRTVCAKWQHIDDMKGQRA